MEPKTSQMLHMLTYSKGSDFKKLVREVEPKFQIITQHAHAQAGVM